MDKTIRPLWQLLLLSRDSTKPVHLTCEECFVLLEYDTDLLAAGATFDEITPFVYDHLSICSECRKKFDGMLEKFEREIRVIGRSGAGRSFG